METYPDRRPQEPAHKCSRESQEACGAHEARPLYPLRKGGGGRARVGFEPGWMATRALISLGSDQLMAVMVRPSFRPIDEQDIVPIWPCPYCHDGGLRTAGSVRTRRGREQVRACDTCGRVEIGDGPLHAVE